MTAELLSLFRTAHDLRVAPFVIAEVAQSHDGSLGTAHAFIDAAAGAGAHAIKFQTHIAAAESTAREPWRVRFSPQDETRYDYWRRMEFTPAQWQTLAAHARDKGLVFLSSPFSPEAVDLLEQCGVPLWKVASGELDNVQLLDAMIATRKPLLISTGMSGLEDVDAVVERCRAGGVEFAVMQCTTAYPCPAERVGLNVLAELRDRYQAPVGLSDHSGTIYPSLAAATLGARFLEVHLAFSREMFGPDVPASVTVDELRQLVAGVDFIHRAMSSPVDKTASAAETAGLRTIFGRSVVAARDLAADVPLAEGDLALKKPGGGLAPASLTRLIGRRTARALTRDEALGAADVIPPLTKD